MVIEPGHEIPDFFTWLLPHRVGDEFFLGALLTWLLVGLVLIVVGVGLALLFAIVSRGPGPGFQTVMQRLREGTVDLLNTSPLRVLALAQLSVKEAVRKKVFVALVLFAVIIAGAAWLMTPGAGNTPATLYLDFVLFWAITVPVLLVALFLSVFSLPGEIANRTIYTLVTKPVRPTEIVLGRIVGFTAIGSVMLLVMGIVGYFFVVRTLDHTHTLSGAELMRVKVASGGGDRMVFRDRPLATAISRVQGHSHEIDEIDIQRGIGQTKWANQHRHPIHQRLLSKTGKIESCQADSATSDGAAGGAPSPGQVERIRVFAAGHGLAAGDIVKITGVQGAEEPNNVWVIDQVEDDSFVLKESEFYASGTGGQWQQVRYEVGAPQGYVIARVPRIAERLQFLRRDGVPGEGTNVGTEWDYRKAIEGGTEAAAEFYFTGLKRSDADEDGNLRLEMTLGVFRTIKGEIEKTIPGNIELVHPDPERAFVSEKIPFSSSEFERQTILIPREKAGHSKKTGRRNEKATLFDDYVSDQGELIVRITCAQPMQYLSMARRDVYFLAAEDIPAVNYLKGCVSIWFQLILVVSMGVAFSTFLNGFVALLTTGSLLFASMLIERIREIATGVAPGGASFESMYRIFTRAPMTTELDPNSYATPAIIFFDYIVRLMLHVLLRVLPDLSRFSSVEYVAQGFSVPWNNLFVQFFMLLGFVIPLCLLAHYILKGREIAA
jgi:hypothetical protein